VDLWSLGAVFSDFLVWSIGGPQYREEYRKMRNKAISKLPHVTERGFDACFHDGIERLPAVDDFHKRVLKVKRQGDFVSLAMSDLILKFMMVEPELRLLARQGKGHAVKMIEDAQAGSNPKRAKTPDTVNSTITKGQIQPNLPGQRVSYFGGRKVSVEEVYEELKRKSSWKFFKKHRSQPSEAGMSLPGMQGARNKINLHGGRDQAGVLSSRWRLLN
jgi:hypothetical protein